MLDGLNDQKAITFGNLPFYCFSDIGVQGKPDYVKGVRYFTINEFVDDLKKLIGEYSPESEIPELIGTRRENIQVSDSAPVVYTARLQKVIEHPLVRRLASVNQLGLVSLVYPGATHSRIEHSLGTFGITARYIQSLYNDTLNPIFKQLVTSKYIKMTLLASLLHDIGQYPLAHDLEDVSQLFFGHEELGKLILDNVRPVQEQTLLFPEFDLELSSLAEDLNQTIEQYWGVSLSDIWAILHAKSSDDGRSKQSGSHIDRLCKSLIDGPIDSDKVDYLERDARHCIVKYGFGIDRQRLFKCLTVACNNVKPNHLLIVVGVHEKGRISAESILFSRYAMLTQVYWHHTMRSIKALLHFAASEILAGLEERHFDRLRNNFFHCAVLEEPIKDLDWEQKFIEAKAKGNINYGDMRILGWLWQHTTNQGKQAIEHIINRGLFKRILTVYTTELTGGQKKKLERIHRQESIRDRLSLREEVERAIRVRLQSEKIPDSLLETQGFSREKWAERLEQRRLRCVVDYPTPRKGAAFGLQVVGQWGDRPPRGYAERQEMPTVQDPRIIPLDHFSDGMKELEKSIACLRVFWLPDEHLIIKEILRDDEIKSVVLGEIDKFKPTD